MPDSVFRDGQWSAVLTVLADMEGGEGSGKKWEDIIDITILEFLSTAETDGDRDMECLYEGQYR